METRTPVETNGQAVAPAPPPDLFNAKSVVQTLETLMHKVTAEECTPATVNSACNCASRIVDVLRLHVEVERLKRSARER